MVKVELDQYFKLSVAGDKMTATIRQFEDLPNDIILTYELIESFCEKNGIVYGLKKNIVHDLQLGKEAVVAKGKAPERGKDAFLDVMKTVEIEGKQADKNELGQVDYKDVLQIASVRSGDIVGKKIPATAGMAGMNVYGEVVEPKSGKDIKLRAGKNTKLDEQGLTLHALIDGQLSVHRNTVHVLPTYEVNGDISLKTGNIDFVGNVIIRGSIPPGFEVKAGGDIHVIGTVEAATLKAGGSVSINAGIVGQNKSLIEAEGDVMTTFINQGDIHVGGDIKVEQTIFHSKCTARGKIICTKGKGLIVGGSISAGNGIEANEIGNDMQTSTSLFIGVFEKDIQRKKELEERLKKSKDDLIKLAKLLKVYVTKEEKGTLTAQEITIKLKVQQSLRQAKQVMDEVAAKLEEFDDEVSTDQGFIRVAKTVYPNVVVQFGKYRRKLTSPYRQAHIALIDSEVVIQTS